MATETAECLSPTNAIFKNPKRALLLINTVFTFPSPAKGVNVNATGHCSFALAHALERERGGGERILVCVVCDTLPLNNAQPPHF